MIALFGRIVALTPLVVAPLSATAGDMTIIPGNSFLDYCSGQYVNASYCEGYTAGAREAYAYATSFELPVIAFYRHPDDDAIRADMTGYCLPLNATQSSYSSWP